MVKLIIVAVLWVAAIIVWRVLWTRAGQGRN